MEQITLDRFQNCVVLEGVSVTFDPEVDLDDDAVGRSCYERFYSVRSPLDWALANLFENFDFLSHKYCEQNKTARREIYQLHRHLNLDQKLHLLPQAHHNLKKELIF